MNMKISAKDFENGSTIPVEYTCDGENISPELFWSGVPTGTRSMVLIMDDPDIRQSRKMSVYGDKGRVKKWKINPILISEN